MEKIRIILQLLVPLIFVGFIIWGLFHKCEDLDPCFAKAFALVIAILAVIVGLGFLLEWTYSKK